MQGVVARRARRGSQAAPTIRAMGYLVGVGPEGEVALDAARGGGVVEGAVVASPQVPLPGGVCHAVASPNTTEALCGHEVTKVLDQAYTEFVGLEHCAACEAALAEEGVG